MRSQETIHQEIQEKLIEIKQLSASIGAVSDSTQFGPAGDYLSEKLMDTKKELIDLIDLLN